MARLGLLCVLLTAVLAPVSPAPHRYTVREDDTVFGVARRFGVSMSSLIEANHLDNPNLISPGMTLVIPYTHVVEKGEGYLRIARAYGTTMEALIEVNGLTESHMLRVGDVLLLPPGARSSTSDREDSAVASRPPETVYGPGATDEGKDDSPVASTSSASTTGSSEGFADASSVPYWPLVGEVVKKDGKLSGTEIIGQAGEFVYAVNSGTVVWNARFRGYGNVVMIETYDNHLYLYGWTENSSVVPGDWVPAGTRIADVAVNPYTGEARLFFAVFKNGTNIDPEEAPRG